MAACSFKNESIRDFRYYFSMSQIDLAKMLGVSRVSVSKWENGFFKPSVNTLNKLITYGFENGFFLDFKSGFNFFFGGDKIEASSIS